ncbi:MAG: hypothetical protein H0V07_09500, partial [Propionibacteriales bacterium]|nr:hypothetical protein [Propionibacteriales bacterium]
MRDLPADPLFLEPGVDWRGVSPKLVTERRIPVAAVGAVGLGVLVLGIMMDAGGAPSLWPFGLVTALIWTICALLW